MHLLDLSEGAVIRKVEFDNRALSLADLTSGLCLRLLEFLSFTPQEHGDWERRH
jgi:hypothetical protein